MHQQLYVHKVEEKIYFGVRERKRLNISVVQDPAQTLDQDVSDNWVYSQRNPKNIHGIWPKPI